MPLPGLPPELSEGAPSYAPQPNNVSDPNLSPEAAQQALDALTRALGENPVTQNAAEALAQGNALQAANELRELAGNAGELAPQTLEQLADSLQSAAEELQAAAPEAAQAIGQAARQLDEAAGAPNQGTQAGEALEGLAQLVEGLDAARQPDARGEGGGEGQGAGSGAGQNGGAAREERSAGTTDRLQGEGETVELPEGEAPEEGGVLQPPERPGGASEQRDTPYTSTSAEGTGSTQPWDPLTFPWRLRNVIQRYFSPP